MRPSYGKVLSVRYYGDPILRKKAVLISDITPMIEELAGDMIETMYAYNGIGIAGPQVGHLLRIFVSIVDFEDEAGELHLCDPLIYINPKLLNPSDVMVERSEGCLSIPGVFVPAVRPATVEIEAMDLKGKLFKKKCARLLATHVMHENDHLNGVLNIDRVPSGERKKLEPTLRQIKKKYC